MSRNTYNGGRTYGVRANDHYVSPNQNASARLTGRLEPIVRAKLNDPSARIVRWQQNRDGSESPVWATAKPSAAYALGLVVSSMADDYGPEPEDV